MRIQHIPNVEIIIRHISIKSKLSLFPRRYPMGETFMVYRIGNIHSCNKGDYDEALGLMMAVLACIR